MSLIYEQDYWGFVYIWYDCKRKKYCIGSHLGSLTDGYVTSTGHMKSAFKKRPNDFTRKILYLLRSKDNQLLKNEEQKWLNLISDNELDSKYYNRKKTAIGWTIGLERSPEIRAKISASLKGRPRDNSHLIGRKNSIETINKMKKSAIGKRGPEMTPERRKKISETLTGRKQTKEHVLNALNGRKKNVTALVSE